MELASAVALVRSFNKHFYLLMSRKDGGLNRLKGTLGHIVLGELKKMMGEQGRIEKLMEKILVDEDKRVGISLAVTRCW